MAGFDTHSYCARCRDKGKDPRPLCGEPDSTDCKFCSIRTSEQRSQLSTPSYKLKKEKLEAKQDILINPSKDNVDSLNPSLLDPASVSVIETMDGQGMLQPSGFSGATEKKQKKVVKEKVITSKAKLSSIKLVKLVQTAGRPKPVQMQRLQDSPRSGLTASIVRRLYSWQGHWTGNLPSRLSK